MWFTEKIANLTVSLAGNSKTDSQVFGELELLACDGDVGYRDGEVGKEEDGREGEILSSLMFLEAGV
jgi:hypothetical protein